MDGWQEGRPFRLISVRLSVRLLKEQRSVKKLFGLSRYGNKKTAKLISEAKKTTS